MANKFTRYLKDFGKGLLGGATNPKGTFGNFQHATRAYIDNQYQFSPRTKFLFYVEFVFDENAIKDADVFEPNTRDDTLGILVRAADLPKFTFDSEVKNQYNRKKIVYKQINYNPINITMFDDTAGLTNALWALYYGHYVNDRFVNNSEFADDSLYRPESRFGLDVSREFQFFKSIKIYTMSRQRFHGYELINPRIQSWNHGDVNYAEGNGIIESQMTLEYEAVKYSTGLVKFGEPGGFADLYYDRIPSPITLQGGSTGALFGPDGTLAGIKDVFGAVATGEAFASRDAFLGTAIRAINTYQSGQQISSGSLQSEIAGTVFGPFTGGNNSSSFPSGRTPPTTNATPRNLGGPNGN